MEYATALFFQYLVDRLQGDFGLVLRLWQLLGSDPLGDTEADLDAFLTDEGAGGLKVGRRAAMARALRRAASHRSPQQIGSVFANAVSCSP